MPYLRLYSWTAASKVCDWDWSLAAQESREVCIRDFIGCMRLSVYRIGSLDTVGGAAVFSPSDGGVEDGIGLMVRIGCCR